MLFFVSSFNTSSKVAILSLSPSFVCKTASDVENIESARAGMLIQAEVRAVLDTGLFISVATYLAGIIDRWHVDTSVHPLVEYQVGEKVTTISRKKLMCNSFLPEFYMQAPQRKSYGFQIYLTL